MVTKASAWDLDVLNVTKDDPLKILVERDPMVLSEDKKGHDITLYSRFPKYIGGWIAQIMEKHNSPYKTRSDLVRDAVFLGMVVLNLRYQTPEWRAGERMARIASEVAYKADMLERIDMMVKDIKTIVASGDVESARKGLFEYMEIARGQEHGSFLTRRLRSQLALQNLEYLLPPMGGDE